MSDKLQAQINRGNSAKALLESETLRIALDELREDTKRISFDSKSDALIRENCWLMFQAIEQLEKKLATYVSNGNMAQAIVAEEPH